MPVELTTDAIRPFVTSTSRQLGRCLLFQYSITGLYEAAPAPARTIRAMLSLTNVLIATTDQPTSNPERRILQVYVPGPIFSIFAPHGRQFRRKRTRRGYGGGSVVGRSGLGVRTRAEGGGGFLSQRGC